MGLREAERDLLGRCLAGDQLAWRSLYRQYSPRVTVFVRGMLGPDGEVEDVVQQVFIELLGSVERFRGDASLTTWLHRLASRTVARELRSRQRRRRRVAAYAEQRDELAVVDPVDQVEAAEDLQRVRRALDRLRPSFREVWVMRELEAMEVAEVADVLRIRPATVRTRHHRARSLLLAALAEEPSPAEPADKPGQTWHERLRRRMLRGKEVYS